MDASIASVSPAALTQSLRSEDPPLVIDVRREARFLESTAMVAGAIRRDPEKIAEWKEQVPRGRSIVMYCVHGHEVSQGAARELGASYLEGGVEAWIQAGGAMLRKPAGAPTRWVTRERPKIDRIACPWLVRRFVDADAQFVYVAAPAVMAAAEEESAIPYDVPDVEFSHIGERCSFDAFLDAFRLHSPALRALALIVRTADTARPELAPEAAGLAAVSLGLSSLFANDREMLERGMLVYDALYAWCQDKNKEVHTWNPAAYR